MKEVCYALVPVWVCSYFYNKKRYSVYVNGQTGKADGEVLVVEEKTIVSFILLFLSAFGQYFGILFLLDVLLLRFTGNGKIEVLLTLIGMFSFIIWIIIGNFKSISGKSSEDMEWEADIEYNKRAKNDPKRVRMKKFIIGIICFIIGAIICGAGGKTFLTRILSNLPELLGVAFLPGILWTIWFMSKHTDRSVQKEEVEYTDYVKAAQSVILDSSEKLL